MKVPTLCPVCGAYSVIPDRATSALLAVCDVLAVKALESLGKWVMRQDRSRFNSMRSRGMPFYLAYTVWTPDSDTVTKAIKGAWDVVPALLASHASDLDTTGQKVTDMLDEYVHDLARNGKRHDLADLAHRMEARLGLPVHMEADK